MMACLIIKATVKQQLGLKIMMQESDKPKIEEKGIPGPRLVAWMVVCMVFFPLLCAVLLNYARHVGKTEGVREGYSAVRDPKAWLFIVVVLVVCALLARLVGLRAKKQK